MERVKCPDCGKKSVERRAPNRPGNVKLRQVDGIHDEFVCRNGDCKWTGDEEQLGEPWETETPDEQPATEW
jgi:hypothetical protein